MADYRKLIQKEDSIRDVAETFQVEQSLLSLPLLLSWLLKTDMAM